MTSADSVLARVDAAQGSRPLQIGLVNNMPDAALLATERQFRNLLQAAAGARPVHLRLFHMTGVLREEAGRRVLAQRYSGLEDLPSDGLDALVVTGAEPLAERLQDEPYWRPLCELVDWAAVHSRATLWSCLAAHAAVLHLDGIARRRLPAKCSGVFDFERVSRHELITGVGDVVRTPHSRHNALDAVTLAACGYTVLTRSEAVGVDAFVRDDGERFLFLQGHPEYDADALPMEYRRDLRRFLAGELATAPSPPHRTFDPGVEMALAALGAAVGSDRSPEQFAAFAALMKISPDQPSWSAPWRRMLGNWLTPCVTPLARAAATA